MQVVLLAELGRGNETSLGFVLNRHKATILDTTPTGVKVGLTSDVDPADLFQARCDELVENLTMYGFEIADIAITQRVDA